MRIWAIIAVTSMLLLAGCRSARIEPLDKPNMEAMMECDVPRTLEYSVPTVDVYLCPVHGRLLDTYIIRGRHYCAHCLHEKLLDD